MKLNKMLKHFTAASAIVLLAACAKSPELTPKQAAEQSERCAQLKKQIQDLKGKPVRRTTATEYYEKECLRTDQPR